MVFITSSGILLSLSICEESTITNLKGCNYVRLSTSIYTSNLLISKAHNEHHTDEVQITKNLQTSLKVKTETAK